MDLTNLIQQQQQADAPQQQFTKEEYAARKKAEREELWAKVDELATAAFSDKDALRGILDFAAQCNPQNAATLLLLHEQNPEITVAKTAEAWRREGRTPRAMGDGYTAILRQRYTRADGTPASGYNISKVYDISQVRGRPMPLPGQYAPEELVAAIIQGSQIPIRIDAELPAQVQAQYVPTQHTIYVRNDMDAGITCALIAREQAQASFDTDRSYRRQNFAAQSFCAAYIVAKKYGLDTSAFNLAPVVDACAGMDAQGKRNFLSDATGAAYKVSRDMEQILNARQAEILPDAFAIGETTPAQPAPAPAPAQTAATPAQPKPKARSAKQPEIA